MPQTDLCFIRIAPGAGISWEAVVIIQGKEVRGLKQSGCCGGGEKWSDLSKNSW